MSEQPQFPSFEIADLEGLYTAISPDKRKPSQLDVCDNCDFVTHYYYGVRKLRGNKRVLAEIYKEGGTPKSISSVLFYRGIQQSGQVLRQVLLAAGTTLQLLNADGTLTPLKTGLMDSQVWAGAMFDDILYLQNQNFTKSGLRDKPLKYDGAQITRWGVDGPGYSETPVSIFSTVTGATTVNGTVTTSTDNSYSGYSWRLEKTSSSFTSVSVTTSNFTPFLAPMEEADRVVMWVYIPKASYKYLSSANAIAGIHPLSVTFSADPAGGLTNFYQYDFDPGTLNPGFNRLTFSFKTAPTSIATNGAQQGTSGGTFDPTLQPIQTIKLLVNTKDMADLPIVYFSNLFTLDLAHPVVVAGPDGTPNNFAANGTWKYAVTFMTDQGVESNASFDDTPLPAQRGRLQITGAAKQKLLLSEIPVSSDPQVTARRIYRTVNGGNAYFYVTTIFDNVTTTYEDTATDTSLPASSSAPFPGDSVSDFTPPPYGSIVKTWKRTIFIAGDPLQPNALYFSADNRPEVFPLANVIYFDAQITGIFESSLGVVVTTGDTYWRILSDNPNFIVDKTMQGVGGIGPRACGSSRLAGYSVNQEALRFYNLAQVFRASDPIQDKYRNLPALNLSSMFTLYSKKMNGLIQFNPDLNGNYTSILMWQHFSDTNQLAWWSTITPHASANLNFLDANEIEDPTTGVWRVLAGASDGMCYELFEDSSFSWTDADGNLFPMISSLRTSFLRPGIMGQDAGLGTGRVQVKSVEIRSEEGQGLNHTWHTTLETADGGGDNTTPRDQQTINMQYPGGWTLSRYPTQALHAGEYIRLSLMNDDLNRDVTLLGIKITIIPRPGQFPVVPNTDQYPIVP